MRKLILIFLLVGCRNRPHWETRYECVSVESKGTVVDKHYRESQKTTGAVIGGLIGRNSGHGVVPGAIIGAAVAEGESWHLIVKKENWIGDITVSQDQYDRTRVGDTFTFTDQDCNYVKVWVDLTKMTK